MTETLAVEDFSAWESQVSAAGACSHPIRLSGKVEAVNLVTGETAEVFRTWADATVLETGDTWRDDHPLYVACGNRREKVCPSCSAIYKRDARQLVRAGLSVVRASRSRSLPTRACSPLSPPRRSARCMPAASVAGRCYPAVPAVTATGGCARMAGTSPARSATARMIRGLAARCAPIATTTGPRCCSTRLLVACGAASSPTCLVAWLASAVSALRSSASSFRSGSSVLPSIRHAASSTSMPSSV